ncbi:MAG: 4Fe-4S binding protein [Eggerthellaceae bacterium]|nr:4Fe-4S binding protein [Eggerthellaceae bacterium]
MSDEVIVTESAGQTAELTYGNHIVQYSPEYSLCAGCEACSIMCGLTHDGFTGRENARIKVHIEPRSLIHTVLACQQCDDHPCYEACARKDQAMCLDPETGIAYINEEFCIGCGRCMKACRFTPSRISMKKNKKRKLWRAVKCDLCRGNPEGPQCIKWCQVRCLGLSDDAVLLDDVAGKEALSKLKEVADRQQFVPADYKVPEEVPHA